MIEVREPDSYLRVCIDKHIRQESRYIILFLGGKWCRVARIVNDMKCFLNPLD